MAVSSGVRAVDIKYLLCEQAVASHGVALAVTRGEQSLAMRETAGAAVGQRCEPLTRAFDTRRFSSHQNCLGRRVRQVSARTGPRSGLLDHTKAPRRREGDAEPHRVLASVLVS